MTDRLTTRLMPGDVIERLRDLPDKSVQCVVTSPPYYGLRAYLDKDHPDKDKEIGGEKTLEAYVAGLVAVFREVRRVLRDDGTVWLNIGDSYAQSGTGGNPAESAYRKQATNTGSLIPGRKAPIGLKPKDMMMVPATVSMALRQDGWYLRSKIIWEKPNCMPERVIDRPTASYEEVFLLSKSYRYFYDAEAIQEDQLMKPQRRLTPRAANSAAKFSGQPAHRRPEGGTGGGKRNARNVWKINTKSYRDAHFATMPLALAERCIKAGSKSGDTVLDPFGGAGTTAKAANDLGRHAVLIDINKAYIEMAAQRLENKSVDLILDPVISEPISTVSPEGQTAPMSAPPITITISITEHTPPHQLRAIQELLGFAVNPVAPSGNGADAKPLTGAHGTVKSFDQVAPITPEAWAAVRPAEIPALSAPHTEAALPAVPAAPIGPVIPAQIGATAAPPAPVAEDKPEKIPGKRGRVPASPEIKAAAAAAGMKVSEYQKQQAEKLLAVAALPGSKDPGMPVVGEKPLASTTLHLPTPPAEPRPSILKSQPGPGETMPVSNGAAPPPAAARDAIGATDPLRIEIQEIYNYLNTKDPGLPFRILRDITKQFTPEQVPDSLLPVLKKALETAAAA